jgi:hypothetical protein
MKGGRKIGLWGDRIKKYMKKLEKKRAKKRKSKRTVKMARKFRKRRTRKKRGGNPKAIAKAKLEWRKLKALTQQKGKRQLSEKWTDILNETPDLQLALKMYTEDAKFMRKTLEAVTQNLEKMGSKEYITANKLLDDLATYDNKVPSDGEKYDFMNTYLLGGFPTPHEGGGKKRRRRKSTKKKRKRRRKRTKKKRRRRSRRN